MIRWYLTQRGGIDRAVVARREVEPTGAQAARPELVDDLPGHLLGPGFGHAALSSGEGAQGPGGERGGQGKQHAGRPQRVPPEQRAEPRASGRDEAVLWGV